MSKFQVGQTVYAVKTSQEVHDFDFDTTEGSLMYAFADKGAKGEVIRIDEDGDYRVQVSGDGTTDIFIYTERELTTVPRGEKVVKFVPAKKKPTKNLSVKPVDKPAKTLYAVVKDGVTLYVSHVRAEAREVKTQAGGLKAGVTIITYKPLNEIR